MPIKIVITGPDTLSEKQINDLRDYLLAARKTALEELQQATVVPNEELRRFFVSEVPEKPITGINPGWKAPVPTEEQVDKTAGLLQDVIDKEAAKPRKKRELKAKPEIEIASNGIPDNIFPIVPPPPPPLPRVDEPEQVEDVGRGRGASNFLVNSSVFDEPAITHEELVAYVIEGTRTKAIDFEDVMDVVASFRIPTLTLNLLGDYPDLVPIAYERFKALMNKEGGVQ